MTKKLDTMALNVKRQEDLIEEGYEKLLKLVSEYNEEKIAIFAKAIRAIPKDKAMDIINFFVESHYSEECSDNNLVYATPVNGMICPRCAMLWLLKNRCEASACVFKDFVFFSDVKKIVGQELSEEENE